MTVVGAISSILSVRFVTGNSGSAGFYLSFYPVKVSFNGNLAVTGIPEILLPWLIIGLALIGVGVIFFCTHLLKQAHNDKSA